MFGFFLFDLIFLLVFILFTFIFVFVFITRIFNIMKVVKNKNTNSSDKVNVEHEYIPLKCPNCGASLDGDDIEVCDYCNSRLVKVVSYKNK